MKAAIIRKIDNSKVINIETVPVPKINRDEVLVKVKAVGICGSDLNGFNDPNSTKRVPGLIMGHEASGVIERLGEGVKHFSKGERVAIDPQITCGKCSSCKKGLEHLCDEKIIIGSNYKGFRHGAMAEYVVVHKNQLHLLPEKVSFVEGAMIEPVSNALHIFNRIEYTQEDQLVIMGMGTLGLCIVQIAKYKGLKNVIVVDMSEDRLNIAKKLGADITINASKKDVIKEVNNITEKRGVDIVIEAVGIDLTYNQSIEIVKKRGTIVFFGAAQDRLNLDLYPILHKELHLVGSAGANKRDIELALNLIEKYKVNINDIVTHKEKLINAEKAFKLLNEDNHQIKIILKN